jgi:transcription elongation factor GreB
MSKAFTRESDDAPSEATRPRAAQLPPGAPNYITASGARRLRDELDHLLRGERTADVDQRIQALSAQLDGAEVVEPSARDDDRVHFGATVTVRAEPDHDHAYRIVGAGETDPRHGAVSWVSPVARALLGASVGDLVTLPGKGEVEIVAIAYDV